MDSRFGFLDRADAGRQLAGALRDGVPSDALVCGIPRGGIDVAAEVAAALGVPLRAIVARKVGAPGHRELAIGAVGPDGAAVIDEAIARRVGATPDYLEEAIAAARAEVAARVDALPGVVRADEVAARTVVVVDDGVATGATAAAVGRWLANTAASRRMLALPVGPPDTVQALRAEYDEVVVLATPSNFVAVGQWYRDFRQVSDEEVARRLG